MSELISGSLICYPTYVSRRSGLLVTPEVAVDELMEWQVEPRPRFFLKRVVMRWVLSLRRY